MDLKIKLLRDNSKPPIKMNPDDAAFDCYVNSIEITDKGIVKIGLGFAVEVPKGYQLNLVARSSISKTGWLLANSIGIIDSGYKDEVCAVFYKEMGFLIGIEHEYNRYTGSAESFYKHVTNTYFPYKIGERCCQVYLQEIVPTEIKIVNEIDGERSGFGSTGK